MICLSLAVVWKGSVWGLKPILVGAQANTWRNATELRLQSPLIYLTVAKPNPVSPGGRRWVGAVFGETMNKPTDNTRADGRALDQMRVVRLTRGWAKHAEGSCLTEFGDTKVLCTASIENTVPPWLRSR